MCSRDHSFSANGNDNFRRSASCSDREELRAVEWGLMSRLLRVLLNAAPVLSALFCLATVVLWVRSYWTADGWNYQLRRRLVASTEQIDRDVAIEAGCLSFGYGHLWYDDAWMSSLKWSHVEPGSSFWHSSGKPEPIAPGVHGPHLVVIHRFLGFEYGLVNPTPRTRDLSQRKWISVPLWLIVLCTACPPVLAWQKWRRKRRAIERCLCSICNYDLRATPDRCPECGTDASRTFSS
jgi:hypothetical protein